MKKRYYLPIFIFIVLLSSCRKQSVNCGVECSYDEELVLNFGFEGVSLTQDDTRAEFSGTDTAYQTHNSWDSWAKDANNEFGWININYEDGSIDQRIAEIVTDPLDPNNQVLHYQINSTNVFKNKKPLKSRVQIQYHDTKCLREYYQTVKIMLPGEMAHLKNYDPKIYWLSIFEFWNNGNWTNEKYPFRITVGINKDQGTDNDLYFHVEAQTFKRPNNFTDVWEEGAEEFPIPFDQWMELELYLLEGDENNGRFYMAVTPEGGSKQVLFDVSNTTQHPKEKCPDGYTHIQPLKWYTSDEVTEHMENSNKSLQIYWDDWVVYRNKQP